MNALCDLDDTAGGEAIQLDESPSDDDEEMMDDEELDDEQMEMDAQAASSFRTGRLQDEQLTSAGDAVIITDDDDAVAITTEQTSNRLATVDSRTPVVAHSSVEISGEIEDDVGDDLEDGDVDDLDGDEVDREVDEDEEMAGDDVCVIEDEEESRREGTKANVADVQNSKEVVALEETTRQSAITTPIKGNRIIFFIASIIDMCNCHTTRTCIPIC